RPTDAQIGHEGAQHQQRPLQEYRSISSCTAGASTKVPMTEPEWPALTAHHRYGRRCSRARSPGLRGGSEGGWGGENTESWFCQDPHGDPHGEVQQLQAVGEGAEQQPDGGEEPPPHHTPPGGTTALVQTVTMKQQPTITQPQPPSLLTAAITGATTLLLRFRSKSSGVIKIHVGVVRSRSSPFVGREGKA
ncbi:hypothetical protein F7725_013693, partial [Dissostichus mawsoni]